MFQKKLRRVGCPGGSAWQEEKGQGFWEGPDWTIAAGSGMLARE